MADVYASRAELTAVVGAGTDTNTAARLDMALIAATGWVQFRVGLDTVTVDDLTAPYTLSVVACPAAYKAACLAAAVRFFKAPDVPFGVMGMGEYGVQVRSSIPEAEAVLYGHREAFGFA